LLTIEGVTKTFGGLTAVNQVSFLVARGEIVGLVGPNGSGKTTLLNILSGHQAPDSGRVLLDAKGVNGLSPDRLARLGVLRMFQATRVFRRLTASDNLVAVGLALGLTETTALERAGGLLTELGLDRVAHMEAGHLSGGQLKLLEFGSCFMVPPRIALLDEPFAAIHPTLKDVMAGFIRRQNAKGQTFIIVSHDMPVITELCPRTVCMGGGEVIALGATREVLNDRRVIESYLGEAA
jgi:ABC-type branched-subunit amino acid transport system ATPase component